LYLSKAIAEKVEASGSGLARLPRVTIQKFLDEFRSTVEAEAVNSFWDSRTRGHLKKRPEKHGQELLGVFARAKLAERGAAIREAVSGIGFVDVLVTFSSGLLHVVELKVLRSKDVPGPTQVATYMKHRGRKSGWLVFFDARPPDRRIIVPSAFKAAAGIIRTVLVDINPVPPSRKR
jgi:hypothetical protein